MKSSSLTKTAFIGMVFYGWVIFLVLFPKTPFTLAFNPRVSKELWASHSPLKPFGYEFSAFKAFLPPHEKVSFIMDFPFNPYVRNIDQFYSAQAYLTPTLLSHEPDQRAAIIYCSNTPIAKMRMEQTGYRIILPLAEGKGIAVKK